MHREIRNAYNILVGKPEEKRPLVRLGVCGGIILTRILGNKLGGCGMKSRAVEGSSEHCNETSGSIKGGELLN
jgi:hypothetical protein